jgi:FkbM family methyltransferase
MAKLQERLREWGRATLDGFFCSNSPGIKLVGDAGSGWTVQAELLNPDSICYCAGVGLSISFELELAHTFNMTVVSLDPSPTGIQTIRESADLHNIHFFPVGLSGSCGSIEFALPTNPEEGSYSAPGVDSKLTSFECSDLPTLMRKNGHHKIDLLKMDIEGFEYEVLDQIIKYRIPIRQICVEFHPWLKPRGRFLTIRAIHLLSRLGYRLIYKKRGDHTFLLDHNSFEQRPGFAPALAKEARLG